MDDMTSQMNTILNNPEMMQKIMSLAKSLDGSAAEDPGMPPQSAPPGDAFPEMDLSAIQKIASFAGKSNIDNNQRSLLKALTPYLSKERIAKLERAMRAAKLASIASTLIGNNNALFQPGR